MEPVDVVSCVVVVCLVVVVVTAVPAYNDDSSLATRILLASAVFDGRVAAPVQAGGHLLFRVRRVYKGWHGDLTDQRVTRLNNSDPNRLVLVRCGSAESARCRLGSALVGQRYFVFAESFQTVEVNAAARHRRRLASKSAVVYRSSGPLVPLTVRVRRLAASYSHLSFGQYIRLLYC